MTKQVRVKPEPEVVADAAETKAANATDAIPQGSADKRDEQPEKPQESRGLLGGLSSWMKRTRKSSIEATPAFVVNNASNILGASHVATEMLMFKSGLKGGKLIDNPGNPVNWVVEPARKIGADIFKNAKTRDFSVGEIFRGNPVKNIKNLMFDTHAASIRELEQQTLANRELLAAGKQAAKISLGNPWQTRTTGTGLLIWTLSAVLPERKESDEEIERMAKLRTLHPLGYVGERLKQAVWFPEWPSHKREMLGLGYLGIGIFSMLGSWRNRKELKPFIEKDMELISKGLKQGYTFNPSYFVTSVVSFIAGLPLLFALDERKAYSTYGSLSLLRIPFLFDSIGSKIRKKEEGWQYYTAGKLTFQAEDMAFSLIGGATKRVRPDGSVEIVDHDELKKKAIAEAKEEKAAHKAHHQEQSVVPSMVNGHRGLNDDTGAAPSTKVMVDRVVQHAMPERVEAKQKEMAGAVG